jgi:mRNA interferase RelE/StbE
MPPNEKGTLLNNYRIFETQQFQKDLKQIALSGRHKVTQNLGEFVYPQLREHPHFGPHIKKLKGIDPETWQYRIGAWRFFYEIDEQEKIVYLLAASHRGSAY